jgi:hypothetical protein
MRSIRVASSSANSISQAVSELAAQLAGQDYAIVLFFCADSFDQASLAVAMRSGFPVGTSLIGCTTAGEIGPAGYQQDSIVAIGLPADDFFVTTALLPHLDEFNIADCEQQVRNALQRTTSDERANEMQGQFAFLLVDGLSRREEALGKAVQLTLGSIPVIGGSAGDSLQFRQTCVFHDGSAHNNAAVLAIISTRLRHCFVKAQHFEPTANRMVITGARPEARVVTEINGYPAATEYARIVGIPPELLNPDAFAAFPVVVRVGGQEYVRSIQKVNPDNSLSFYCAIDKGVVLSRALGVDPLRNLIAALDAADAEIGPLQAVLACDCILRNLEFKQSGQLEEISALLRERKVTGFLSFGELHRGIHVNQTFNGIAFGQPSKHKGQGT